MSSKNKKHNNQFYARKYCSFFAMLGIFILLVSTQAKAETLNYYYCNSPQEPVCILAFKKIAQLQNPIDKSKKRFFYNDVHVVNQLIDFNKFVFPAINIAETDLDGDGYNEIIAELFEGPEEEFGLFCPLENGIAQCPHFIIQDRNTENGKTDIKNFRIMGPFYTSALGLSTDERVGGFKSLRAYRDPNYNRFSVLQYDKKTDTYYQVQGVK